MQVIKGCINFVFPCWNTNEWLWTHDAVKELFQDTRARVSIQNRDNRIFDCMENDLKFPTEITLIQ